MAAILDWEQLKMAHLVWRINFRSLLNGGSGKLEDSKIKDHTQCDMGKWLHGEGREKFGTNPMYHDLVEYHKIFHEMATNAYQEFSAGNKDRAAVILEKITDHSNALMALIDQFKTVAKTAPVEETRIAGFEPYVWTPAFEIGISQIDAQHKSLVSLTNELGQAVHLRRANHIISEVIYKLEDYTKTHFSAEEMLLESINYKGISEHRQKHADFINYLSSYRMQVQNGQKNGMDLHDYLGKWLINHIQVSDRDYVNEINARQQPVESGLFSRLFRVFS